MVFCCPSISSERGARAGGAHGEREAQEDPQASDHLLQLPARRAAEALPESTVPRAARESRAGGAARPDADTGKTRSKQKPLI